ncbi:MAG: hypothetical protein Q8W45_02680 [Candidatus Palauibacterales bacterium]|nr:hypothetical protein [Candidatus Palauibacterales bacterium]MDP2482162.1 hypothetical protein [Candidatus Palauibacterales bacterium]
MMHDRAGGSGFVGRFLGSWRLALGELVIVALGVLIALWADQWMQAREEVAREVGYLERLHADIGADLRSLRFSADQARNRLAITRQVDAWLHDPNAMPDPDSLVVKVHFAGVLFPPTISKFTIDELKSTGDLRLLRNEALKRQIADYYNQIGLQIDEWSTWGDEGITETYFRELAFVMDPELRLRAGTFDPALMRRFLSASGEDAPSSYVETRRDAPEIGATRADADRMLHRMRTRPNFEGYLRDSMYWAHLSAQLLDGVILSAEELEATIAAELETLKR